MVLMPVWSGDGIRAKVDAITGFQPQKKEKVKDLQSVTLNPLTHSHFQESCLQFCILESMHFNFDN